MGKIKEKIDKSPTLSRMLSLFPNIMLACTLIITAMGFMLDYKMQSVDDYIANQGIRAIEKQYYKITKTPEDVKPMDLFYAVDDYKCLGEKHKKPSLDSKAHALENYYLKISGVSK